MKFFSLISQGDVHPSTAQKVIKKEAYQSLVEAHEIVVKAEQDALDYREKTAQECEVLRKEAQEKGFQEGLARFNEQLLHFEQKIKQVRHEMQQAILPLALKAAKKIIDAELKTHPEVIVDIVLQTLTPVIHHRHFTIYVNKADKALLEEERPRIKNALEQLETLAIQEREDIAPGGCVIETEAGIINASLDNQWRVLEAAFQHYMP